jgi:hypothetical protein
MNFLSIGLNKLQLLEHLPDEFLILDDGEVSDHITGQAKRFNIAKHRLSPLKDMDEVKAETFIAALNAANPGGDSTLTQRYSNHILFKRLIKKPARLDALLSPSKDPYERDAFEKIERILLSDVLEPVLNTTLSYSFGKRNIVRLDRAELGDKNCLILGNLIIAQYSGTVIIPDFGFYAIAPHMALIRQSRLIAGISSFDEVPDFRSQLLLFANKKPSQCTPDDAKILAKYAGLYPDPLRADCEYNRFIEQAIGA